MYLVIVIVGGIVVWHTLMKDSLFWGLLSLLLYIEELFIYLLTAITDPGIILPNEMQNYQLVDLENRNN